MVLQRVVRGKCRLRNLLEAQYKEDIAKNYLRTDTAWPVLLVAVLLSGEPWDRCT